MSHNLLASSLQPYRWTLFINIYKIVLDCKIQYNMGEQNSSLETQVAVDWDGCGGHRSLRWGRHAVKVATCNHRLPCHHRRHLCVRSQLTFLSKWRFFFTHGVPTDLRKSEDKSRHTEPFPLLKWGSQLTLEKNEDKAVFIFFHSQGAPTDPLQEVLTFSTLVRLQLTLFRV